MDIVIEKDISDVANHAASLISLLAGEAVRNFGRFSVALSGGSTPRELYKLLSSTGQREKIDWTRVCFFFGDERCVPPDSADSNFRMASETLLGPLDIPASNIFRWETENSPEFAAADYERRTKEFFHPGAPSLDLALLGMGPDGHTASLFPGSPALREKKRLAVSNWVEKLGSFRLTFTFPMINNSLNVMFLVTGADKAAVLERVLNGTGAIEELPAKGIEPASGRLTWLVDSSAASLLSQTRI